MNHHIETIAYAQLTDGIDGLTVKPHRYLGDTWMTINDVARAPGGRWVKGAKPSKGAWRLPK